VIAYRFVSDSIAGRNDVFAVRARIACNLSALSSRTAWIKVSTAFWKMRMSLPVGLGITMRRKQGRKNSMIVAAPIFERETM